MHIKRSNGVTLMSEELVCLGYSDMNHGIGGFKRVSNNEFECNNCGAVMVIDEPVLVHDDKGRLKMQVSVEQK